MLLLFVLIAYVVGLKRHKMHFGKKFTSAMSKSYTNHVLQFTMWIVIIAYPPVSRRAIQYITCSEKIDGKQYLVQDYTLECFDGQWNEFFSIRSFGFDNLSPWCPSILCIQIMES